MTDTAASAKAMVRRINKNSKLVGHGLKKTMKPAEQKKRRPARKQISVLVF
jgi:hypothetical protein